MPRTYIQNFPQASSSLASEQKVLFALGTGIFGYQVIAELVHKFAQQHFENWGIHPTYATGTLTLCWIGFILASTSPLLIYFCFIATGVIAFVIYRSPLVLGSPSPLVLESPPPSGLLDMVAEAQAHPKWEYCLPHETFIPLLETAMKHPDKQSIMLLGDSGTGKTLQVEHLAWMLGHKKFPNGSFLEKVRIFRWNKFQSGAEIKEILKFFIENPCAYLFIDKNPKFAGKSGYSSSSDFVANESVKSAMQRGELRLIGTATPEAYTQHFAPDDTLNRLWHQLPIHESNKEQCAQILEIKIPLLVKTHGNFSIATDALLTATVLSKMIWPKLKYPDSAFDLLNRVCGYAVKNPSSDLSGLVIDAQGIIQAAKSALLIEKNFDPAQLQPLLNPSKQSLSLSSTQELLPEGLTDMVAQVESHPEWAYGANSSDLFSKIVTAQAESWRQSILLFGHATNTNLLLQNLAWKIKNNKLPPVFKLEKVRIVRLNSNYLKEDGDYGSAKQESVKKIIEYLANRPNTICIVEDADFLIEESSYLSNTDKRATFAMKEALSERKLRLIGTTSALNFKDKNAQNEQYWIIHTVSELTLQQCVELLMQAKEDMERRYAGVKIAEEAIKAAVILAEAYKPQNRSLWESAYDVLCQGCTKELLAKNTDNALTKEDISKIIIEKNMTKDGLSKLIELVEKKLKQAPFNVDDDEDGIL